MSISPEHEKSIKNSKEIAANEIPDTAPLIPERRSSLANIVDNLNLNGLNSYYPKDDSLFKQRIDNLNVQFYLQTEKYLNNGSHDQQSQDQLFLILFKQISLYIEEVDRLNKLLKEKNDKTITAALNTSKDDINKKMSQQQIINQL